MSAARDLDIRPYRVEDARRLHEAALESVAEVEPWLPWCRADYSLEEAEAWTRTQVEEFEARREFHFTIVDGRGRYLGGCALNGLNGLHRFANLGYWVRTSATGRGVATTAVRLLAQFAFAETDLERLEILCATTNAASRRVAEKAGAVHEGVLRSRLFLHGQPVDADLFSIVRARWPGPGRR